MSSGTMYASSSTQQPAAICALKSPADAIHILEAVRLGLVPRVTRRLTGQERAMIRPGTVWVWEEEETNMRRWTDGRRWGASRVGGGGFLVYTETNEASPHPDDYGYHRNGKEALIKQTYSTSMTTATGKVQKFHVVAYSSKANPQGDSHSPLPLPHQLPSLSSITVAPGIWPEWEHRREQDNAPRRNPLPEQPQPLTATADSYRSPPAYHGGAMPRYHPYYDSRPRPEDGRPGEYGDRGAPTGGGSGSRYPDDKPYMGYPPRRDEQQPMPGAGAGGQPGQGPPQQSRARSSRSPDPYRYREDWRPREDDWHRYAQPPPSRPAPNGTALPQMDQGGRPRVDGHLPVQMGQGGLGQKPNQSPVGR